MSIEAIGYFINILGEIMVGFTAIMVHHRVWKEHKIDEKVFVEMKREQYVGIVGIVLIVIGFVLQLPYKF